MLSEVMAIVQAEGWFDTAVPFEKTIYLSQGSAQCVLLSRNGRAECFVKFTNLMSLAAEAERSARCFERFAAFAPPFVGYASSPPLEVLATRAVSFRPVTGQALRASRNRAVVTEGLERFFRRMRDAQRQSPAKCPRHAWFEGMGAYFGAHAEGSAIALGLRRLADALHVLAPIPQHGDLVLNNLGLRTGGELVIFDWEDYGAVELPGLDLFTLESSIRHDVALQSPGGRSTPALDTRRLCDALGVSLHLYESLRLSYALAFRYLKRNYNAEIRSRLDELVESLAHADGEPVRRGAALAHS